MTGLAALLPATVTVEQTRGEASVDAMLPEEREIVRGAVATRIAEFATGRECAHRALARLGRGGVPVLTGARRQPLWPEGVVGSITHCAGFRAAAVARASDILSLGIDAEVDEPLPDGTLEILTIESERRMLDDLYRGIPDVAWGRVLFSAKESIYKTWFPLTGRWLDFIECTLTIDPDGTFRGDLLVPGAVVRSGSIDHFRGSWAIDGPHILTAAWVDA